MSQVCNWLSIFSCMRGTHKTAIQHQVHPGRPGHFDAVIVWKGKEKAKANTGGVAYEVILKPAASDLPRPSSPPKDKGGITHDDIAKKLMEAEERRQSLEAQKLDQIAKGKQRAQDVLAKVQEENQSFSRATQEKLRRSMEVNKENREAQIQALQCRLRDHLVKVEETCKKSDMLAKELDERIKNKLEKTEENRNAQLEAQVLRLREHANHVEEVLKMSDSLKSKISEEEIIQKLQKAIRNREDHLRAIQKRNQEHEKKIEEVRKNKSTLQGEEGEATSPVAE